MGGESKKKLNRNHWQLANQINSHNNYQRLCDTQTITGTATVIVVTGRWLLPDERT
jgi:hypothetical protein